MIYDQFQRLQPDTPRFFEAGRPGTMMTQSVTTKPMTALLLVNKIISSEYGDTCGKQSGVIVSAYVEDLVPGTECEENLYLEDDEKVFFIHMHAGDWMSRSGRDDPKRSLDPLKDWFAHWSSQMPQLDSITFSMYLDVDSIAKAEECKKARESSRGLRLSSKA